MAYLNWTEALPPRVELIHLSPHQARLCLRMDEKEQSELVGNLEEIYSTASVVETHKVGTGGELRLGLSSGVTLFWKESLGSSRALLAHPESAEWVGTALLSQSDGRKFLLSLKSLELGQLLTLGQCILLGALSNLDIVFSLWDCD